MVVAAEISQVLVTVKRYHQGRVVLGKDGRHANIMHNKVRCSPVFLHANPYVASRYPNAFDAFKRINELFRTQDKSAAGMERKLQ